MNDKKSCRCKLFLGHLNRLIHVSIRMAKTSAVKDNKLIVSAKYEIVSTFSSSNWFSESSVFAMDELDLLYFSIS